jgi:hypothetical protein
MILFIIGVVAVVIAYNFFSAREVMLQEQVDNHGGMKKKYAILIDYLLSGESYPGRIVKEERDMIYIIGKEPDSEFHYVIKELFDGVMIDMNYISLMFGKHNRKIRFSTFDSNTDMIRKIEIELPKLFSEMMNKVSQR